MFFLKQSYNQLDYNPQTTFAQIHHQKLKESIILDSGSNMSIFSNPELVKEIKPSGKPLLLRTNSGNRRTNKVANVGNFGKVWYNTKDIAKIFGIKDKVKRYRVTMDTTVENSFNVHVSKEKVKILKQQQKGYTNTNPPKNTISRTNNTKESAQQ